MIMNALNVFQLDFFCKPLSKKNCKINKDFERKLDFDNIKSPVKISEIQEIIKKTSISISVSGYDNKVKY